MATSISNIEKAFMAKYEGKVIYNRSDEAKIVPVFLDYPDLLEGERKFPSISILFNGMELETELFDTQLDYEVEVDTEAFPRTFKTRRIPEYYNIEYEVSCYSLSAFDDRELFRWCESRYAPRDFVEVDGVSYHLFRRSFSKQDDIDFDTIIYKKTWTYSILADIEDTDNDIVSKGVDEIRIQSNVVNTDFSKKSSQTSKKTLHRVVAFDDQRYWFNSNKK